MTVRRRLTTLGAAALLVVSVSPACERKSPERQEPEARKHQRPPESPERTPPKFDWRSALDASPTDVREAGGEFDGDCNPDAEVEALVSGDGVSPFEFSRSCHLSRPDSSGADSYRVDRILYANGEALAVSLEPSVETPLSASLLEAWKLPELSIRRHRRIERDGGESRLISFRVDELGSAAEVNDPIAIDLVGTLDNPDRVDRVLVYGAVDSTEAHEALRLGGPPTTSGELILPASVSSTSTFADVSIVFGLSHVELRTWDDYTLRTGDDSIPGPTQFSVENSTSDAADGSWESQLESFLEKFRSRSGTEGSENARFTVGLAPNQTAPVGRIEEVLLALDQLLDARYQIVTRQTDSVDAPFSKFSRSNAVNFDLALGAIEETNSRTGRDFLNLSIRATFDGFQIETAGSTLPPVDGCPNPGPTICLVEVDRDLQALLDRAQREQKNGAVESAASALSELLWSYDWAGLHRNIRDIRNRVGEANNVYLSADPGLPVAILVQAFDLTGFRFRKPDSDECGAEFASNEELRGALPCTDEAGELERLFSHPSWHLR